MRFLVRLDAHIPAGIPEEQLARLNAAETEHGRALRSQGTIESIWRLEGRRSNVGIWNAVDRAALDAAINGLPLRRWISVSTIEVLLPHPVSEEAAS